jgi:hypothetical protein
MKKFIGIWLVASVLWLGMVTVALADFQVGWEAYNSGDYRKAFSEFKLLAEQGNESGQ